MTDFLVLARAPYGQFHRFTRELVDGLRALHLGEQYGMRTYTHVIADETFTDFSERRKAARDEKLSEERLRGPESQTLEFKATFAVNLRRLQLEGVAHEDPKLKQAVVRTICGFLNSPEGGALVLGVLEVSRETERGSHPDGEFLEWLQERFGYEPPPGEPGERPNAILGVEHEWGANAPYRDEDRYLGAVRDILTTNIDPDPWPWLRMAVREVDGHKLVVLSVRPASEWCYARETGTEDWQFYVREAASTRAYRGRSAESYRRAYPREHHPLQGVRPPHPPG
jgi:hypothetical protein